MRQKRSSPEHDPIEASIRAARSIGQMERLAGIGQAVEERAAFWKPFMSLPAVASLDAGVAELKRRIREQAVAPKPARIRPVRQPATRTPAAGSPRRPAGHGAQGLGREGRSRRRKVPRLRRAAARGRPLASRQCAPLPRPARTRGGEGVQQTREGKGAR